MVNSIGELGEKELFGKKVLLRVDFNVPILNGEISEYYRIKANKETLDFLTSNGAIVGLVSHITAVDSFETIADQIKEILGVDFNFISDCTGEVVEAAIDKANAGDVFLLDNLRKYAGEEKNDPEFAKKLAEPFDLYVNNAFSASHRNHASLVAVTKFLLPYAGFLLMKELAALNEAVRMPKNDKILIVGGVKIATKFPVIKNFLDKAENILIGGAVANIFLAAENVDIKKSLSDKSFVSQAKELLEKNDNIFIPEDYNMSEDMILDIGGKTIDKFMEIISKSKIVIWNGPLGKVETAGFSFGSEKIARAIIDSGAYSIIGGGDTIAFLEKLGLAGQFSCISTAGGAMLEFLAGNQLPGISALGDAGQ